MGVRGVASHRNGVCGAGFHVWIDFSARDKNPPILKAAAPRKRNGPKNPLADDAAQILREHGPMTVRALTGELEKKGRATSENSVSSALSRKRGVLIERIIGTRKWRVIEPLTEDTCHD